MNTIALCALAYAGLIAALLGLGAQLQRHQQRQREDLEALADAIGVLRTTGHCACGNYTLGSGSSRIYDGLIQHGQLSCAPR